MGQLLVLLLMEPAYSMQGMRSQVKAGIVGKLKSHSTLVVFLSSGKKLLTCLKRILGAITKGSFKEKRLFYGPYSKRQGKMRAKTTRDLRTPTEGIEMCVVWNHTLTIRYLCKKVSKNGKKKE